MNKEVPKWVIDRPAESILAISHVWGVREEFETL
jgi:hypothetical protein